MIACEQLLSLSLYIYIHPQSCSWAMGSILERSSPKFSEHAQGHWHTDYFVYLLIKIQLPEIKRENLCLKVMDS